MVFGVCAFDLALIVLFADESWYRRDIPKESQPNRGSRWLRLVGVWQIRHHKGYYTTMLTAYYRVLAVFVKPVVLPTLIYYALSFMWSVGTHQRPTNTGAWAFADAYL